MSPCILNQITKQNLEVLDQKSNMEAKELTDLRQAFDNACLTEMQSVPCADLLSVFCIVNTNLINLMLALLKQIKDSIVHCSENVNAATLH